MKHPEFRVLFLPDKFKGSLVAEGAIAATRDGILAVIPQAELLMV